MRYIGSKARIAARILEIVGPPTDECSVFVDAFAGTGAVAEAAARAGWKVRVNDHLVCATTLTAARLTGAAQARFRKLGGYRAAVNALADAHPVHGTMWREYSPASRRHAGVERRYFSEANAARIDGIRRQIARWSASRSLTAPEERLLVGDLLEAASRVSNIAGTYGCFLSDWTPNALADLVLEPRKLFTPAVTVEVTCVDVGSVPVNPGDVVYFDPPYTKRQYAAYYHILETIAIGDAPLVGGITGLRPWEHKSSEFCYKRKALRSLTRLIEETAAERVFLSYSSEGHVPIAELIAALEPMGRLTVHALAEIGRYRPNQTASDAGSGVTEYVLALERNAQLCLEGAR